MKQLNTYFKWQVLLFVLSLLFGAYPSFAQDLHVVSFEQRMEPMTVLMQQRDLNGDICALVKVQLPTPGCKFEGNVIASRFEVSEYWVYLSGGSRYLNIKCPGHPTLFVDFSQYDISGVSSKSIYYLQLEGFGTVAVNPADSLIVRRNPEESVCQMKIIRDAVNKLGAQHIGPFMNGIAPVTKDKKVAFMDKEGNLLTAFTFDSWSNGIELTDSYWVVTKNGLKGVINSKGRLIADCRYKYIEGNGDLIALCEKVKDYRGKVYTSDLEKAKFDVMDAETGDLKAEGLDYESLYNLLYPDDTRPRQKNRNFVDSQGKKLLKQRYEKAYSFSEGLACVKTKEEGWIIIDQNGEKMASLPDSVVPYRRSFYIGSGRVFRAADGCFHDGLLAVSTVHANYSKDRVGYVNMLGEMVIPCKYRDACRFSEGWAAVQEISKDYETESGYKFSNPCWFYINKSGETVLDMKDRLLDACGEFINGMAIGRYLSFDVLYETKGKTLFWGAINTFDRLSKYGKDCFRYNLFPVEKDNSNVGKNDKEDGKKNYGFINSDYELVIPYEYSTAEPFKDEFTSITGEKGCGLLDSYGNVVWLNEERSENLLKEDR